MQIQIVMVIKKIEHLIFILLLSCLNFGVVNGQAVSSNSIDGYDLYIYFEETASLFTKPISVKNDSMQIIEYRLHIPNQNHPTVLFSVNKSDDLQIFVKGAVSSTQDYRYSFLYNSMKDKQFLINKETYLKNKIDLDQILSSNLEDLDVVLKKSRHIYIIEKSLIDCSKYIVREVTLNEYKGL